MKLECKSIVTIWKQNKKEWYLVIMVWQNESYKKISQIIFFTSAYMASYDWSNITFTCTYYWKQNKKEWYLVIIVWQYESYKKISQFSFSRVLTLQVVIGVTSFLHTPAIFWHNFY